MPVGILPPTPPPSHDRGDGADACLILPGPRQIKSVNPVRRKPYIPARKASIWPRPIPLSRPRQFLFFFFFFLPGPGLAVAARHSTKT